MDTKPTRLPLETADPTPPPVPPSSPAEPQPELSSLDLTYDQVQELREQVIAALKTCFDPEIPINIYELGLIYDLDVQSTGAVAIRMTLTSPACPVAGTLPPEVQAKVKAVPNVTSAKVDLVWDPPWDQNRMSDAARLQLGIDW
jgi:FeS assembly SUF system protein